MPRSFNIAGPCIAREHYMLPPERRLGEVMALLDDHRYFTLAAGRQTGKTTSAKWLVEHYNSGDRFRALWVDVQTAREEPDPRTAFDAVLQKLDDSLARSFPDMALPNDRDRLLDTPSTAVLRYLRDVSGRSPRPLVVFFDEADCLIGKAMVSFLTQLRDGYIDRDKTPFPSSIVLVGARAIRDYALEEKDRRAVAWLGSSSPFNIQTEAKTLAAFTPEEVAELVAQHTRETGQRFEPASVERIVYLSQGHPWLVCALADQIVRRDVQDRSVTITADHVEAAKETIILERRTHIDSLVRKLREPRVMRILDPMISGERIAAETFDDDLAYVIGLGIVRVEQGQAVVANPIYREVLPRALSYGQQIQITASQAVFVRADGGLDMPKLMAAWQVFWREDGHLAAEGLRYKESGPHLMLMAFLQRAVNGGGRIDREYGLGRGALDLLITWKGERHAVEVKLRRDTQTEARALEQVARYLDHAGLSEGYLVMFDLRATTPWDDRLTTRAVEAHHKRIHIVGC